MSKRKSDVALYFEFRTILLKNERDHERDKENNKKETAISKATSTYQLHPRGTTTAATKEETKEKVMKPKNNPHLKNLCQKAGIDYSIMKDPEARRRLQKRLAAKMRRNSPNVSSDEVKVHHMMTPTGLGCTPETDEEEHNRLQKQRLLDKKLERATKRKAQREAESPEACKRRKE